MAWLSPQRPSAECPVDEQPSGVKAPKQSSTKNATLIGDSFEARVFIFSPWLLVL
jgi:hypothetical protein